MKEKDNKNIWEMVLEPILDTLDKDNYIERQNRKWDLAIAREIVKDPSLGPRELADKTGSNDNGLMLRRLRSSKLNRSSWRENYIRHSKLMIETISKKEDEGKYSSQLRYFRKYNSTDLTAKLFWILLTEELRRLEVSEGLLTQCNALLRKVKRSTLYDLFFIYEEFTRTGEIGREFDLDLFFYKIEQVSYLINSEINSALPDDDQTILFEALEIKNDLLRTMDEEIANIGKSVRVLVEEVEQRERRRIFQMMNDADYGYLLDTLFRMTMELLENTSEDSEVKRFLMLFRKFMIAIKLNPAEKTGGRIKIPVENLESYNYIGSAVKKGESVKIVEVINPGWKLGKQPIIKTTVREVKRS